MPWSERRSHRFCSKVRVQYRISLRRGLECFSGAVTTPLPMRGIIQTNANTENEPQKKKRRLATASVTSARKRSVDRRPPFCNLSVLEEDLIFSAPRPEEMRAIL